METNAELLKNLLLKGLWETSDTCDFFVGHKIVLGIVSGVTSVHNFITGNKVVGVKRKEVIKRWNSVRKIWVAAPRGGSTVDINYADCESRYGRDYCIAWARSMQVVMQPSSLWEESRECLRIGLEEHLIKASDLTEAQKILADEPESESERIRDANSKKAEARDKEIKKAEAETAKKPEQKDSIGDTKGENLYRLIGILKDMLTTKEVILDLKKNPESFKLQKDLNQYISGLYGEDLPSKGLQVGTLNDIWAAANKVLKKDKEP